MTSEDILVDLMRHWYIQLRMYFMMEMKCAVSTVYINMGNTRLNTLLQLCVIYWFSELGAPRYEPTIKVTRGSCDDDNITVVNTGSNVTFCCITHQIKSTVAVWYKGQKPVVELTYKSDDCVLRNFISAHWKKSEKACGPYRFSIVLTNVQREDEGEWYCVLAQSTSSSRISLKVETQTVTNPPKKSSTTLQSTPIQSTPTTTRSTDQSVSTQSTLSTTGRELRTHRNVDAPRHSQSNNMIVIGGSIGGAIFILVIIIIVVISLRARKNSQSGDKRPGDQDRDGTQIADEAVVFDDDFGGQYAQIGITGAAASTSSNQKEKNRKETEDDEMIVAENTLYESYNKEEHDKGSGTGASVCEVGADVYSVVQKPPKSQGQSSNQDGNQASGSQPSGPDGTDVYSVVQKPLKLEVKAKVQSPDDGVGDVYSVVKKPAKN